MLTHDAWVKLREDMSGAGFPIVRLVGQFEITSPPVAVWLYEVMEQVGKPLCIKPHNPRKLTQVNMPF
jgi:hypothetical protein